MELRTVHHGQRIAVSGGLLTDRWIAQEPAPPTAQLEPPQRLAIRNLQPESGQGTPTVGPDRKARTNLARRLGAFQHLHLVAGTAERDRGGHSCDPGAGDKDSHSEPGSTQPSSTRSPVFEIQLSTPGLIPNKVRTPLP